MSHPVPDHAAYRAREARYAEAIWDRGTLQVSINAVRDVMAVADAEHAELRARLARIRDLMDDWDGEIGAQEDYRHTAALRAVEACLRDLCNAWAGTPDPAAINAEPVS